MTGPCSGAGVGTAKPGFTALQFVGPGAIGGALAGLSGWAGAALGATIGLVSYDLSTLCPSGPPAMPTFSTTDIELLLAPIGFPGKAAAEAKFADFLTNIFWGIFCECSSGTPTVSAPAAYPTGGPQATVIGPPTAPCVEQDWNSHTRFDGDALPLLVLQFPTQNVTSFRCTLTSVSEISPGSTLTYSLVQSATFGGASLRTDTVAVAVATPQTVVIPRVQGAYFLNVNVHPANPGTGRSSAFGSVFQAFCDGQAPGGTQPACCPPDPIVQAQLDQILSLITLIQRQAVPFAYVASTAHAGLSGAGTIAIQGLIGVKVDVTTLPSAIGREGTSPTEYFDMGFLTFGTADGYPQAFRLERSPQIQLPSRCSAFTSLAYDLAPGVVVTITELVREP
jgi:hypothetical protein